MIEKNHTDWKECDTYRLVKDITGGFRGTQFRMIKDIGGTLLTKQEDILK